MFNAARAATLGNHFGVSSTHYLATEAGVRMFRHGGNAIDAGVAAGIALGILERDLVDFGGVAPIMIFRPGMREPETLDGLGRWPRRMSLPDYVEEFNGTMPVGLPRSVTPGAPDAWLTALARHGRLTLAEVLEPSIELAGGFPVFPRLSKAIHDEQELLRTWPSSAAVFLPDGRVPKVGEVLVQPDLQNLLLALVAAEKAARSQGRSNAIMAARDSFYLGDPAARMVRFLKDQGSRLDLQDLELARVSIAPPVRSTYRGIDVYACGPWCQGPMVPMTLNILECDDVSAMAPNDPEFLHLCAEALKLVLADREGFFGDPEFVTVPMAGLLDKRYAQERRAQIGATANPGLPLPGNPWPYEDRAGPPGYVPPMTAGTTGRDTAYVAAMDVEGNAFSATPSDSGLSSPIIPGLGIVVSPRGCQLRLDPDHPARIAPGKRPRLTPNPAMLLKDGRALMPFGCPGGDAQSQAMVQTVTHVVDFGMNVQEAIEYPRLVSLSAPDSFHPHGARPGVLLVEDRVTAATIEDLQRRGHLVEVRAGFSPEMAAVCAVRELAPGVLEAGADPRRDSMASSW